MSSVLIIIAIIVCVLLGLIVLIQNPKGGSQSLSGFSGSNNIMGVQRTGDFLEKGTWGLIITLMVLVLLINVSVPKSETKGQSLELQKQINKPQMSPMGSSLGTAADSAKK